MREFLKNIEVISSEDGSTRKMTEQEIDDMMATFEAIDQRDDDWSQVGVLEDMLPGLEIENFHGYCPVQGEGTINGERFYFRARYSSATLSVGSYEEEECADYWNPKQRAEMVVTDDEYAAGWLNPAEVVAVFPELVKRLQFQTPDDGKDRLKDFCDQVSALADQMKANKEAADGHGL